MCRNYCGGTLQVPEPEPEPVEEGLSVEELTELLEKANAEVSAHILYYPP